MNENLNFAFSESTFLDPDDHELKYEVKEVNRTKDGQTISGILPNWLVFISETRLFFGIPTLPDINSNYSIELRISDESFEIFD